MKKLGKYRKIYTRIWNDQKFNSLSDDGKLVFFQLLSHPHLTPIGAMRASMAGMASDLKWDEARYIKAFAEIISKNMVHHDAEAVFLWLPNFLKYNQPESPNVVKSWEQYLDYLPECELKDELIEQVNQFVANNSEAFQKALPEVFSKGMPNQEQEQEQEQKQEEKNMSGEPDVHVLLNQLNKTSKTNHVQEEAIEILNFLNEKTGRVYRPVETNLKLIISRLKSGASQTQCFQVIAKKTREWREDPKMAEYLRPATLFNATKFEQYVGELVIQAARDK